MSSNSRIVGRGRPKATKHAAELDRVAAQMGERNATTFRKRDAAKVNWQWRRIQASEGIGKGQKTS